MSTETELKLHLDSAGLRKLRRHPVVSALRRTRSVTRFQKSVYFDTPDFQLRTHELVLRVRHLGRRRIQTVKTMGDCLAGASIRGEWESDIAGDQPELLALQAVDLPDFTIDEGLIRQLRPVFTTEVRRTTIHLGEADWDIELALDEGQIVSAHGSSPLTELELELKQGKPHHLFDLALRLQEDVAARMLVASKAERGYALIENQAPTPVKAEPIHLTADQSTADAFRTIARSCVSQFLANQDCLIETHDPEAVHQMRVALRRLRSAMNVFKGILDTPEIAWLRGEFRWLQAALGAARDTDVFIAETLDPLALPFAGEPGYIALRDMFLAQRREAYDRVLGILVEPRLTHLMLRLGKWTEDGDWLHPECDERRALLDQPVLVLAGQLLARRDRKAGKGMRALSDLPPEERHLVRIDVKKLRYTIDFFTSLYPPRKAKRLISALAAVQDRLGLMNDIAVSHELLKSRAGTDAELLWAAGMVAGWHAARGRKLLDQVADDWKAYDKLPRFWKEG